MSVIFVTSGGLTSFAACKRSATQTDLGNAEEGTGLRHVVLMLRFLVKEADATFLLGNRTCLYLQAKYHMIQ